jgi:hypothetical protein
MCIYFSMFASTTSRRSKFRVYSPIPLSTTEEPPATQSKPEGNEID